MADVANRFFYFLGNRRTPAPGLMGLSVGFGIFPFEPPLLEHRGGRVLELLPVAEHAADPIQCQYGQPSQREPLGGRLGGTPLK